MICFRDTTFCASPGCINACGRQFTPADAAAAKRWWSGHPGEPPIAFGFFCYIPPEDQQGAAIAKAGRQEPAR